MNGGQKTKGRQCKIFPPVGGLQTGSYPCLEHAPASMHTSLGCIVTWMLDPVCDLLAPGFCRLKTARAPLQCLATRRQILTRPMTLRCLARSLTTTFASGGLDFIRGGMLWAGFDDHVADEHVGSLRPKFQGLRGHLLLGEIMAESERSEDPLLLGSFRNIFV